MDKWYEILEEIKDTKGKQKQEILKKYKNDNDFKKILKFIFDDNIPTGISKKKMSKTIDIEKKEFKGSLERVLTLIDYLDLKKHNTGKDEDLKFVKSVIANSENDLEKYWLEKLVIKDIKIGITKTTVNKIFPGLIPQFKPMKLTKYSSELLPKKNIVMPKLDGNYVCVVPYKENGTRKVKYISRSGKEYQGLNHLDKYFLNTVLDPVFFGEIIQPSNHEEHTKSFQKSNGILNSKGDKSSLGIVLFDMLERDFLDKPFYARYDCLKDNYKDMLKNIDEKEQDNPMVKVMPIIKENVDEDDLFKIFHDYKSEGYEGLVIYNSNNIWQPKRVKDILKLKGSYSCDLRVLDVFEHKNGNQLGGVIVDYKGNPLKVGSGFNDEQRDFYWKNPNEIIGKIIEIEYFTVSQNKEGIESLRHPVFKRVRCDKDDVSYD